MAEVPREHDRIVPAIRLRLILLLPQGNQSIDSDRSYRTGRACGFVLVQWDTGSETWERLTHNMRLPARG
jgi:hypothetical protein